MIFLTEEDVRQRCELGHGGEFSLKAGERLTPAANELLRSRNCRVLLPGQGTSAPAKEATPAVAPAAAPAATPEAAAPCACSEKKECCCTTSACADSTYLDAHTVVSKSHPRIFVRGKLDTLISTTVVVQTQFDSRSKLPTVIKNGLADLNIWLWQILQAEVSGEPVPAQSVCGMNAEAIRLVSHDPQKYLGQGHIVPDVALGPNVALLNWLRAQVREVEVACIQVGLERADLLGSLNRLSSAVYVLMLLTVVAESGRDISKVGGSI